MSGKPEEPAFTLILIIVLFGLMMYVVWLRFDLQLLQLLRYIRVVEVAALWPIDDQAKACLPWLWHAPAATSKTIAAFNGFTEQDLVRAYTCFGPDNLRALDRGRAVYYYAMTPDSLGVMMRMIGNYTRWIMVALCGVAFAHIGFMSKRNKFRVRHTLESFIKTQALMWPTISPIVNFHPNKESARVPGSMIPDVLPVFAEALTPEEFLAWGRIPVVNNIPDRERLRRAFLAQLGPVWQGIDSLPLYMQALFVAFALQGVQKREECEAFLGRLALAWTKPNGFKPSSELTSEIKKLIHDPKVGGKAVEIASQYAYRTTALLGILKWARFMGGVLAPAQFLWLRGVDRVLWYSMNNLGRRSFHAEGAGAIAHYMAEENAKKPLTVPRIETAIVTMNQYLANNPDLTIPKREETKKLLKGKPA